MADNVSARAVVWSRKILQAGLISDEVSSSDDERSFFLNSDHDEYCHCDKICDSRPFEFVTTTKIIGKRLTNAYLSSPFLLICIPILIGFLAGWMTNQIRNGLSKSNEGGNNKHVYKNSVGRALTKMSTISCIVMSMVRTAIYFLGNCLRNIFVTKVRDEKEEADLARRFLRGETDTEQESGVDISNVPRHIAVIMDGNRRYGKAKYGSVARGHWDGSKKLVEFSKWCLAEKIQILTVYAFSTENWNREASEVSSLMQIITKYCDELREEAVQRGIKIEVLSTETDQLPSDVKKQIDRMVKETAKGENLLLNICFSYGSRGEILNACKTIATEIKKGDLDIDDIKENEIGKRLLTGNSPDPDIVIRTSGEIRLSNFLLWQLAYSEMFFLDMKWPEISKLDLLTVIRSYAKGRNRRFGK